MTKKAIATYWPEKPNPQAQDAGCAKCRTDAPTPRGGPKRISLSMTQPASHTVQRTPMLSGVSLDRGGAVGLLPLAVRLAAFDRAPWISSYGRSRCPVRYVT